MTVVPDNSLLEPAAAVTRNLPVNLADEDRRFYEGEVSYRTSACHLKRVGKARVSSDSVIYRSSGRLFTESLYSDEHQLYYRSRYLLKKIVSCKKVALDSSKDHLIATDYFSSGHFHWFMEALPRLFCARHLSENLVLLLPDTPYIRKIGLKSLELLDIKFRDIVLMRDDEFYRAENLYFVSRTGQILDEVMREINGLLLRGRERGNGKIYISREKARYRKVLNEEELSEALRSHGVETVHAEELSLTEQLDVFSACRTLIGIHGAGLTNCLFMHPGGNLVELRKNEINVGFWFLADSLGHNYYYYNGIPDTDGSIIGRGCNLTIPVPDFEDRILKNL